MSYYQTTYMSVVIICNELGIFDTQDSDLMEILLYNNSEEKQKKLFENIPMRKGNRSIMEPTYEDDFAQMYNEAEKMGQENVKRGILTEEDFRYRLEGLKEAYLSVKGEA